MSKVYIPHVGACMVLASDGVLELSAKWCGAPAEMVILKRKGLIAHDKNQGVIDAATGHRIHYSVSKMSGLYDVVFPAGTIFKITKVNVKNRSQVNPVAEQDSLTLHIVYSPDPDINKSGRVIVNVERLNSLDMEWIELPKEPENGR